VDLRAWWDRLRGQNSTPTEDEPTPEEADKQEHQAESLAEPEQRVEEGDDSHRLTDV
jgi:hypothetical protein